MAIRKKRSAAPSTGGVGITGDLSSGIEKQLQETLQRIQTNPTGGYTGGTTPPYQQPPQQGPIDYPVWGPNGPPRPPMFPITGPGMRGIPPVGSGWGISGGPIVRQPQPIQQQPQGPQMDWSGLMGKLQGILNPYLSGGTGTAAGGAGGGQNPMQSVMGALMGSLGGFMNQMPSGGQGGMDWQNLAKQIQNPTAGTGGNLMQDIMGLMGQFSSSGQPPPQQQPILPQGNVQPWTGGGPAGGMAGYGGNNLVGTPAYGGMERLPSYPGGMAMVSPYAMRG